MAQRYFMRLSYRGEGFLGWQVQPQGATVQGALEQAMAQLLRQHVSVTGAGRTDTGVNARMMVAHFDAEGELPPDLAYRLNGMLGRNIAVQEIWPVAADAHARFDATERTYRYYVSTAKNPFLWPLTCFMPRGLDFEAMNEAAKLLIGEKDFTSFSKLHTQTKTNICDLRRACWVQVDGDVWYFEVSANRFLRNMVRAIVGTLVEVGRGKLAPDDIAAVIERRDRSAAGSSMPPYALYLWDVKY